MWKHNERDDPAQFIVPVKDCRGRTARARFRINPEDRTLIEAIVASRRFPYHFPCDFYRHAIKLLLESLSRHDDLNSLAAEYQLKTSAWQKEDIQYHQLVFDVLKQQVEQCLSSGGNGEARRILQRFIGRLQNQPRSFGRDLCLERVRANWGPLLEGVYYPACLRHEFLPKAED